jgi:hypothetical protein
MAEPTETPGSPRIEVRRSPMTYERFAPASYFRDMAVRDQGLRDSAAAAARLERHTVEMEMEFRINPDRVQGQGGYFAPPGWLIELFATAKRPGRVLSDLIDAAGGRFPMPAGVQSLNLPRLTTGTSEQAVADLEADTDTDIVDAAVTSPLVPVTGQSDVALQDLEQSPPTAALDWAIWKDMTAGYDADLEALLLYGTGLNGQFAGLTQLAGINSVTYTDATPTLSEMWTYFGQAAAEIGDNRDLPPEVWLMRTARWAWIGSSVDSSLRPIVPPELAPPLPPRADGASPVGSIIGWPVYLDDALLATQGAGANQDLVIACRPSELLLWEGEPRTAVNLDVLSGTLQARIQLRSYAAAILGRYSSGVSVMSGSGFVVQAGE